MSLDSWFLVAKSSLDTFRQNQKVVYVCNRLVELYDHVWLLLAQGLRDHVTERLHIRQIVTEEVAAAVAAKVKSE